MKYKGLLLLTACTILTMVMFLLGCISPAQQVNKGDSFLKQEQWTEAIAAYNKAIELDPKLNVAELNPKIATSYSNRGAVYDKNTEYDKAISDYTKAIELAPKLNIADLNTKLAMVYLNRGIAYYYIGNRIISDADSNYSDASSAEANADGNHNQANYDSANADSNYGSASSADAEAGDYINNFISEGRIAARKNSGASPFYAKAEGYYSHAISDYAKAVGLNPQLNILNSKLFAETYYNRAYTYARQNDAYAAIDDYTKAITLDRKYMRAYYNRGCAYYRIGLSTFGDVDNKMAWDLGLQRDLFKGNEGYWLMIDPGR